MGANIIAIIICAVLLIVMGSYIVNIYNRMVMLSKNIEKSFANIDVLLKQRADEVPNLINVVKQSMNYEQSMLDKLTELRTRFLNADSTDQKVSIGNEMSAAIKSVFAISENYPDLKANTSLLELQRRISQLEDHIADRREFYNESVNMYNIGILEFPNFMFAKLMGYKEKTMLLITDQEKRYNGVEF